MNTKTTFKWFPGLNALRIIAALLVVIMHTHSNQIRMGLPSLPNFPILSKGLLAVSFFFVLSGFLITYLLLKEKTQTKTVNVWAFYQRRIFRIWPLYFLIVAVGIIFYWIITPHLGLDFTVSYPKELAAILYLFFGANVMSSFFHVGGILHVTWSIAVEEQFYLFWAPIAKKIKGNIENIASLIVLLSLLIHTINQLNGFELSKGMQQFVHTLQFHYMGIGALAATKLYHKPKELLRLPVFKNKLIQTILYLSLIGLFFFYQKTFWVELILPLPLGILFAWLVLNTACNPKALLQLENPITHYLGSISYGVYMFHMPIIYATSFAMSKSFMPLSNTNIYFLTFYGIVIGTTLLAAGISYRFLEKPILIFGQRAIRAN